MWFEHDDWDYLVSRKAGDLGDLVRSHNGHWETIPVLVYRALWSMFGLRYVPYELVSIVLSLVGAGLLLVVMLRARVRPWIAISAATLLVLFGDAQANVALRITSITFVGFAVPLGLIQLMLADHDGPRNRRDWLGLASGLLALLCSGVAVAMVFVVGVAIAVKRGWRMALFHALPPAVVFSVWFVAVGRHDTGVGHPAKLHALPQAAHFAWLLVTGTYESLTRTRGTGVALVILLVAAVVIVFLRSGVGRRRDAVVPCAMLVGAFFFAVETGLGRADLLTQGARAVRGGHYMDVVAYLSLPAVAIVADALVRRWRLLLPALVALVVIVVPLNVRALDSEARATARGLTGFRNTVLLIPTLPVAKQVPPTVRPFNGTATPITVGWLLAAAAQGRIPTRRHVSARSRVVTTLLVSLVVSPSKRTACAPFNQAVYRRLRNGAKFRFEGAGVEVGEKVDGGAYANLAFPSRRYPPEWALTNLGPAVDLRIAPSSVRFPRPMICR